MFSEANSMRKGQNHEIESVDIHSAGPAPSASRINFHQIGSDQATYLAAVALEWRHFVALVYAWKVIPLRQRRAGEQAERGEVRKKRTRSTNCRNSPIAPNPTDAPAISVTPSSTGDSRSTSLPSDVGRNRTPVAAKRHLLQNSSTPTLSSQSFLFF